MQTLAAAKQTQITEYVDRLAMEIERLEKVTTVIEERLMAVLRQQPTISADGPPEQEETNMAPLAASLRHLGSRLQNVNRTLESAVTRLEV